MNVSDTTDVAECPVSQRIDGRLHSWKFDGDDPYVICVYCGEMRDALTGVVIRAGRAGRYGRSEPLPG